MDHPGIHGPSDHCSTVADTERYRPAHSRRNSHGNRLLRGTGLLVSHRLEAVVLD